MASLHIKNFGPISDSTKIELTPLMVLIGRQSSGKSAFMKVLCFCRWIEKKIMVSTDDIVSQYTHYNRFIKDLKLFRGSPKIRLRTNIVVAAELPYSA